MLLSWLHHCVSICVTTFSKQSRFQNGRRSGRGTRLRGGDAAWVAASKPEASLISVGSLNADQACLGLRGGHPGGVSTSQSSSATRPSTILKTALLPKCSDTDTDTVMQPTQEHKQMTKAEGEWKSPAIRDLMTNRMVSTRRIELLTSTVSR